MTTDTQIASLHAPPALTQRRILLFWLPLAASWVLMSTEAPFVNAAIARLSEAERMIAAFGIVSSLSITIESPVIMLLATSTALARSRQNYAMLQRFTAHLMLGTTLLHILFGWTPLFDVVVSSWMRVPASLVEPIRLGMRIMIFWSAAIAWRRFKQGVMIRGGQTHFVGWGTLVRLLASAGTAAALWLTGRVPGVAVGALALSAGVIVEAAFAEWAARPVVAGLVHGAATSAPQPDLGYWELVKFHAPMAASTLLLLLAQPLISAALARVPDPVTVLAAWPVAAGLLFLTRSPAMALPEAIIALLDERGGRPALRQFSLRVGAVCAAVLALVGFTPLAHFYFRQMLGVSDELTRIAMAGAQAGLLLPVLMAAQSWLRGLLTANRLTLPLTASMIANLVSMGGVLVVGVSLGAPGVPLAAVAMSAAMAMECLVLWLAARRLPASQ